MTDKPTELLLAVNANCLFCPSRFVVAWFDGPPQLGNRSHLHDLEGVNAVAQKAGIEPNVVYNSPTGDDFVPIFTCPKCREPNVLENWTGLP